MGEKKYFRIGTLFSAILHILLGISIGAVSVILFLGLSALATSGDAVKSLAWIFIGGWMLQIIIILIGIALMITGIVIGSKEIRMISMSPDEYKNKTGKIIGHLIFDAIMIAVAVFFAFLFTGETDFSWLTLFCICEACAFFLAFVCLLSSKINFSIKMKKGLFSNELNHSSIGGQTVNFGAISQPQQQRTSAENLEQELLKLKELKEKGLLSDEEYENQRKVVLEKYSK